MEKLWKSRGWELELLYSGFLKIRNGDVVCEGVYYEQKRGCYVFYDLEEKRLGGKV